MGQFKDGDQLVSFQEPSKHSCLIGNVSLPETNTIDKMTKREKYKYREHDAMPILRKDAENRTII
jgi:hypothetical protein